MHAYKEVKMVLAVNIVMILIGFFAILMLPYLEEKQ
jgi:hypothetical protein